VSMPWLLRFAIGSLFVFVTGAVMIAWACMSTGWETLSWFAWGSVTAGTGLIGTALLSMLSAVIHKGWRRFSVALMSASVFLFLVLLFFAKFA
jgi:ABC-type multidrug transport system permease subunit